MELLMVLLKETMVLHNPANSQLSRATVRKPLRSWFSIKQNNVLPDGSQTIVESVHTLLELFLGDY
jgi:hypothetical protein